MKSKNKKIIIVISIIVVLVLVGVFAYFKFFTPKAGRVGQIDANNVSKIVYIVDANVAPDKEMKKEITDKQDIKNFLDIYRDVTFQKKLSGGDIMDGLNLNVIVYDKSGKINSCFSSAAYWLSEGKDNAKDQERAVYKSNVPIGNDNEYVKKSKAIADKYQEQPYK